jgi:hypothetical protein
MEQMSDPGVVSFTAFVVDHRARPESSQEANTVAGWLRDMGMFFIYKLTGNSSSTNASQVSKQRF